MSLLSNKQKRKTQIRDRSLFIAVVGGGGELRIFVATTEHLGTSHNLSWRGGGEIGGPSMFLGWKMGGLKMLKDDLGGVFKFLLSSIPTEQHDA